MTIDRIEPPSHDPDLSWLDGGGEVGALIRAMDWSKTDLGPLASWPGSLRTVTGMLLLSPVPIVLLWGEKGIMIYNDAYSAFAGDRHPQLLGGEVRKAWDEVADFNDHVMRVVLSGGTLAYKDQQLTLERHGRPEPVWMNLDYSPVIDESGRPGGVISIVVETTERVRAEERIRENEARLRFLDALRERTASLADADCILAVTTRMLGQYLGVAICAYADMDPDQDGFTIRGEWTASGATSIVGHYRLAAFGPMAADTLHAGRPLVLDDNLRQLPPEDAKAFVSLGAAATVCVPLIKEGRLTALMAVHDRVPHAWTPRELGLLAEVTERSWAHIERVRAESAVRAGEKRFVDELEAQVAERTAALRQSEANIRTIFETSHLYQGLLATDGTIRYFNATALAGIDATLDDVIGMPLWEAPWFRETPELANDVHAAVRRAAAGGIEHMSATLKLPTGVRSFDFSLRPVFDHAGDVVAMVPEAVEKTARLQAEQALLQVQKMEALGNLTGGIAHDFNNLLMAVMGSMELLKDRLPPDPLLHRLVEHARTGAERGSALTRRMLAFARRQALKTDRIDLRLLVDGMTELLQRSLGPTVIVETRYAASLPLVEADANQLESALLNLAVNARDAMDGVGTIVIAAEDAGVIPGDDRLAPGHYVRLSLTDTGSGMDDETLKRATEPFFTTKGVGKGTGLGLSMVHGLAEQSGGTLIVRSRVDEGTTAEIWLPAAAAGEVVEAPVPGTAPAKALPIHPGTTISILTVDDDDLVRDTTVEMLEDLGYRVVPARSAAEALRVLENTHVDLVITDHAMPQMTGAQLADRLHERHPGLPVIIATGYAELTDEGSLDLPRLTKPYTQASLAAIVASVVSR